MFSSLTSTVEGVLKLNVAGILKFNDAPESCLDAVIRLLRSNIYFYL